MALNKQPLSINFSQGLDTKTDPFQVSAGRFLSLQNSVFNKGGQLTKRNGFGQLTTLPNTDATYLTTFSGNLTAIGTTIQAYSSSSNTWINKGNLHPVSLSTLSVIRSNTNQIQVDSALAPNGALCTVFTDSVPVSGSLTNEYKYAITDSVTGQNLSPAQLIPVVTGAISGAPRVFLLGNYFVIVFTNTISGTPHLQYVAVSILNPTIVTTATDLSTTYTPATGVNFDGVVANNELYIVFNNSGGFISATQLSSNLVQGVTTTVDASHTATIMSVTADESNSTPVIYATYYSSGSSNGYTLAFNPILNSVLSPTLVISSVSHVVNLATLANNGVNSIFYEVGNAYGYDSSIPTNYIKKLTITQSGTTSSTTTLARSVGLASKSFEVNGIIYVLTEYDSAYQPTYFLLNSSGQVVAELAYSNAGGVLATNSAYLPTGLPSVTVNGSIATMGYLIKDLLESVNKTQGAPNSAGIYAQTGINQVTFNLAPAATNSTEIGKDLEISGGFVWSYDGYSPVEQGFFLWPDNVEATWSATGGSIAAKPDGTTNTNAYFYQVTYEWTDNQGNIFRSAPSVPVAVTTTGSGSSGSIVLDVPTLRLTYKTANPVKIVIYRWSVAQESYYQVTSIANPILNDPTVDYIAYTDTLADASILGNSLIYTTGGVLEDIGPPATNVMAIFDTRLWLLDAEDPDLLWFSKQVIEGTPVEFSNLLTIFTPPVTGSFKGNAGKNQCLAAMDDKLIVFKRDAMGYISGTGPDNTGANSQYSDFIFITSIVGCANQNSIVLTPNGLMFQSDKGIWLLDRSLGTSYIGAPVENFTTTATVLSANLVPGTNQVRFTMDSGITLMYDYYYQQWGTFNNIPGISSTIYQSLHTYINDLGVVFQETPGLYLDGSNPTLMSFTTSWINLAGVQGFERFYQMLLLGVFITPFKLNVQLAYNYNPAIYQSTIVTPDNYTQPWGGQQLWGSQGPWGGSGNTMGLQAQANVFEARVWPREQKCESFQVSVGELYDSSYGVPAGAGLTLSGMNLVVGLKKGYRTQRANRSFG